MFEIEAMIELVRRQASDNFRVLAEQRPEASFPPERLHGIPLNDLVGTLAG
jgi:hypothetical protein